MFYTVQINMEVLAAMQGNVLYRSPVSLSFIHKKETQFGVMVKSAGLEAMSSCSAIGMNAMSVTLVILLGLGRRSWDCR